MGKLTLAKNLIKLNHKLGLVDIGDVVSLASTAYKVSNFSPSEYIDDFDLDMILHREEYERAQRRKTFLTAAALAGGAYLIYKNRESLESNAQKALDKGEILAKDAAKKGKDLAEDVSEKGKEVVDDVADKASDVVDATKDKADDLTD